MDKSIALAALLLCACRTEPEGANADLGQANELSPLNVPEPGTPGGLPVQEGTPAAEPDGPIDPKSPEAAGLVMQNYGALIEQKRFAEARRLWSGGSPEAQMSDSEFAARFSGYSQVHLQVGAPGETEGAAGSIYITVPVVLYGRRTDGREFSTPGTATLRRVNDVPGSTEQQRRWHIASIDFPA